MAETQRFCLRWSSYQPNIVTSFSQLREEEDFVDVTLACEGKSIKAHKMLLSACSPFFKGLLKANPCEHPIVILRDVNYSHLENIIYFIYHGEVDVSEDDLNNFLRTADTLQIKGLAEEKSSPNGNVIDREKTTNISSSKTAEVGSSRKSFEPRSFQKLPKSTSKTPGSLLAGELTAVKQPSGDFKETAAALSGLTPNMAAALKLVNSVSSSASSISSVGGGKRSPTTTPPAGLSVRDLAAQATLINSLPGAAARFMDSMKDDHHGGLPAPPSRPRSAQSDYSDDSERPLEIVDNAGTGSDGGMSPKRDVLDENESSFDSGSMRAAFPGGPMDYEESAAFLESTVRRKGAGPGGGGPSQGLSREHGPINLSLSSAATTGTPPGKQPLSQLSSMALAAQALQGAFGGLSNSSDAALALKNQMAMVAAAGGLDVSAAAAAAANHGLAGVAGTGGADGSIPDGGGPGSAPSTPSNAGAAGGRGFHPSGRRPRTVFDQHQLMTLKTYYKYNTNPNSAEITRLAHGLGLDRRVVKVWFQNKRSREREGERDLMRMKEDHEAGGGSVVPGPGPPPLADVVVSTTTAAAREGGGGVPGAGFGAGGGSGGGGLRGVHLAALDPSDDSASPSRVEVWFQNERAKHRKMAMMKSPMSGGFGEGHDFGVNFNNNGLSSPSPGAGTSGGGRGLESPLSGRLSRQSGLPMHHRGMNEGDNDEDMTEDDSMMDDSMMDDRKPMMLGMALESSYEQDNRSSSVPSPPHRSPLLVKEENAERS